MDNNSKIAAKASYDRLVQLTGFVRERLIGDIAENTSGECIVRCVDEVNAWFKKEGYLK